MDANFFLRFIVLATLTLVFAPSAGAHLPRMEGANAEIKIERPEISQAFYGWLEGKPAVYSINAKAPFLLYVGLLSPRVEFTQTDFSAVIRKDGKLFSRISAEDSLWPVTYEPFANDYYAKGPEWEQRVPAGKYEKYRFYRYCRCLRCRALRVIVSVFFRRHRGCLCRRQFVRLHAKQRLRFGALQ